MMTNPFSEPRQQSTGAATVEALVQAIHDRPQQLVLAVAGAGHSALARLLDVAGASRTLLEALVPYSSTAFDDFLAYKPAQYVAAATARLMAGRAYTRACQLAGDPTAVIGVGCTATIATDRTKRGEHRAHIALRTQDRLLEIYLLLEKGKRRRTAEEEMVGHTILNAIAQSCGLSDQLALPLGPGDRLEQTEIVYRAPVDELVAGETHCVGIAADGLLHSSTQVPPVILSGSFNPLHEGHLGMAEAAEQILGERVTFELSAINVDKPPLPAETILARMGQFAGRAGVLASDAPTYFGKAQLYPGTTFVVGYDTAIRIFAPRYYDNSEAKMLDALRTIRTRNCRFLVAGRVDDTGVFRSLDDVTIPAEFHDLFSAIPEQIFRRDISSTALRAAQQQGSR